ncbi:MAG: dethiobiotin synthase [Alphaproteobacteria bacterium]
MKNIFITGTDTNVGKTVVSAVICKKLNIPYWKPIQSGAIQGDIDANFVSQSAGVDAQTSIILSQPLSPHIAAEIDGVKIDINNLKSPFDGQHIAEGAGGIFVPINDDYMVIDLMEKLQYNAVIVARSGLGTINHTLLTIQALKHKNIPILGVVMIGEENKQNKQSIEKYSGVKVIGQLPIIEDIENNIDTLTDKISFSG